MLTAHNNIKYDCETWPYVKKLDPSVSAILILSINIKFNWFLALNAPDNTL